MARTVADDLWLMLKRAGVKRCYGIVGDALNPTIDALYRHPEIEFVHVRHEEWGAFAASAEAQLADGPVAVCGTAGPGVTHLLNGLLDALHERASVITIAGDVETDIIDTEGLEEVSPYDMFASCSLYTGRAVKAEQAHAIFSQAISVSLGEGGPAVIALPGDVSSTRSPLKHEPRYVRPRHATLVPADEDIAEIARRVDEVMIFGGTDVVTPRTRCASWRPRSRLPSGPPSRARTGWRRTTPMRWA